MRVCNGERHFVSWWLAYILPDLRYIQRFSDVMTSCPHVYTYPPLYSSIECYQVCSSRHSLVWMVRLHSGRWGDSGAVHALYRGRNCGRGGSNVILNGIISRTRSLARSPSVIQRLFDFGGPWFFLFLLNFSTQIQWYQLCFHFLCLYVICFESCCFDANSFTTV